MVLYKFLIIIIIYVKWRRGWNIVFVLAPLQNFWIRHCKWRTAKMQVGKILDRKMADVIVGLENEPQDVAKVATIMWASELKCAGHS